MKARTPFPYLSGLTGFCLCLFFAGCANTPQSTSGTTGGLLRDAIGFTKPEAISAGGQHSIRIHLDAGKDLNADGNGEGLSTVIRLYRLRDHIDFLAAPDVAFGRAESARQALGDALLEARELTLAPGQRLDLTERLGGNAAYLGVVALFHSPAPQRWRFAFAAADAQRSGIAIGVHACAMTAARAAPVGMRPEQAALLSPVKCQ